MTRVAAVDCGTNSIRLLIADVHDGALTEVVRRTEIVRLGQDVDRTGRLAPEALERTFSRLTWYADEIAAAGGVERVRMVATSATRDAANRTDFVRGVESILGIAPDVVSGAEEAHLSFSGAMSGLPASVARPVLVLDIGGGSTELVLGTGDGAAGPDAATSLDIGSVRLTERFFDDDPPTPEQVAAASAHIAGQLDDASGIVDLAAAKSVIGLAGSVTTLGAIHAGLTVYDRSEVHLTRIPAVDVHELTARLLTATHDERAAISVIHPGRVDVIAAGALILEHVLDRSGADAVVVSEHDILDGIAVSIA
jgi:exopolyphosphatase / guanosine-5'-triphosphate,3'-diphosphate pyrophosphatase